MSAVTYSVPIVYVLILNCGQWCMIYTGADSHTFVQTPVTKATRLIQSLHIALKLINICILEQNNIDLSVLTTVFDVHIARSYKYSVRFASCCEYRILLMHCFAITSLVFKECYS